MLGNSLDFIIIAGLSIIACFLIWKYGKFSIQEIIPLWTVVILAATFVAFFVQLQIMKQDLQLRQRPFVGLTEIAAEILSGTTETTVFENITTNDEIKFAFKFENKGLSTAKIELIKVKMFFGYFTEESLKNLTKGDTDTIDVKIEPMYGNLNESTIKLNLENLNKDLLMKGEPIYSDTMLLPNHSTLYAFMYNAKELKDKIFKGKNHSNPIFIEVQIKYMDLQGEKYNYSSISRLFWFRARHNVFAVSFDKSNDEKEPLTLTIGEFTMLTALSQGVPFEKFLPKAYKAQIDNFLSGDDPVTF